MAQEEHTRRHVLKRGGELTAAAGIASTAGCLGSIPFIGGFGYQKWMHTPDAYRDQDHYGFFLTQPKAILNKEDNLEDNFVESYESAGQLGEAIDVDGEDVKHNLSFDGTTMLNTSANNGDITGELEDNDFDEESSHNGYTLYVNNEEGSNYRGWGVGVNGNKVVARRGNPDDLEDNLETAVDTRKGNEDRYVDDSDAMNQLVKKAGTKHLVTGRTFEEQEESAPEQGAFEGMVGSGTTLQVKGENSQIKRLFVFEDNDTASDADLDDWADAAEDRDGIWSEADSINTNVNGPVAIGKATVPSDELGQ